MNGDFVRMGGRRQGKTAAMIRDAFRLPKGTQLAIMGPNGIRYIDIQGDAEDVPRPALGEPPKPEGKEA